MSKIINEMLTQDNDNDNDKSNSRKYILIVVDQLSQLRHDKMNVINIIIRRKEN
jgi:hypothetical protein